MDIAVDSLRRQVREQNRQSLHQNQVQGPGQGAVRGPFHRPVGSMGSAWKSFSSPLGSPYPMTPGGNDTVGSVPMTPTSESKDNGGVEGRTGTGGSFGGSTGRPTPGPGGGGMSYRSPGFASGPAYAYSGTSSGAGGAGGSSGVGAGSGSASKAPRRSAYMAQSPAGKMLPFGSNSASKSSGFGGLRSGVSGGGSGGGDGGVNGVGVGYSSFGSASKRSFSPLDAVSPLPTRSLEEEKIRARGSESIAGNRRSEGSEGESNENELSPDEIASYEEQLNAQQNVLDIALASIAALEERVRHLRDQRGLE